MPKDFKPSSEIYRQCHLEVLQEVYRKLKAARANDEVAKAAGTLSNRIRCSIDSIYVLSRSEHDGHKQDCAIILRSIYDAHLQGLHVVHHPSRAHLFNDFYYVDRAKAMDVFERLSAEGSSFARMVLAHPDRPKREPFYTEHFNRAVPHFMTKRKKDTLPNDGRIAPNLLRDHWYPGTLRDIAKDIARELGKSYELEYELVMHHLSSVLHASSYGLSASAFDSEASIIYGWHFLYRLLSVIAKHYNLCLEADTQNGLAESLQPIQHLLDERVNDAHHK